MRMTTMLNNRFLAKRLLILLLLLLCFVQDQSILLNAQNIPYQLNKDPQQKVSFAKTTDFGDAISILGKMAIQSEGKTIVDQTGQKGPIDIDIPSMHWKMALTQILRNRGLQFEEYPNYYLIVGSPTSGTGQPNMPGPRDSGENVISANSREVKINAIFFQADRVKLKEAGINWNIVQNSSGLTLKTLNLGASFGVTSDDSDDDETVSGRTITHTTTDESGSIDVDALLNLFESNDLGKVLSKPTIKVMDGVRGEIHVGTQFAVNQKDFSGNTVSQYKNAGTILTVTPEIIEDTTLTFIHLVISAEKSSASMGLGEQPEISTQKATTSVLLLDGEQTMIGGLFTQEEENIRTGIPILKDLPWWFFGIRYLAGYNSTSIKNNELIIFIKVELMDKLEDRIARRKEAILGKTLQKDALQTRKDFIELKESSDEANKISNRKIKSEAGDDYKITLDELDNEKETLFPKQTEKDHIPEKAKNIKPATEPSSVPIEKQTVTQSTKETIDNKQVSTEQKPISKDTEKLIKKLTEDEPEKPVIEKPATKKISTVTPQQIQKEDKPEEKIIDKEDTKIEKPKIATPTEKETTPVTKTVNKSTEEKTDQIQKMLDKKVDQQEAERIEKIVPAKEVKKENLKPRYTIQIFSSDDYQKTLNEIKKYKARGIDVYIQKHKSNNKLIYRVRSGRFIYFSEAKKELKKIQQAFPARKDMWIDNI